MRTRNLWVMAACLVMVAPTYVLGQGESMDFPNDKEANTVNVATGNSGTLSISLRLSKGCPAVDTAGVGLGVGPETGQSVAAKGANALCTAAENGDYSCSGFAFPSIGVCAGLACCAALDTDGSSVTCRSTKAGACFNDGFVINKSASADKYRIEPISAIQGAKVTSLSHISNPDAGNTVTSDLLPNWIVRVDPAGNHGNVVFGAKREGGPYSFSVNTLGKSDQVLHQAIADGYNNLSMTPPMNCRVLPSGKDTAHNQSLAPSPLGNNPFVFCPGVKASWVEELSVSGIQGQKIIAEQTSGPGAHIPTLSTWGMALLVGTLVLTGTWLLRRRYLGQSA